MGGIDVGREGIRLYPDTFIFSGWKLEGTCLPANASCTVQRM